MLKVYPFRQSISWVTCTCDISCVDMQVGICEDIVDVSENFVDFPVFVLTIPPALNNGLTVTMEFNMVFGAVSTFRCLDLDIVWYECND